MLRAKDTLVSDKMNPRRNYAGQRIRHFVVVELSSRKTFPGGSKQRRWVCRCDCGSMFVATTAELARQRKSCGCMTFTGTHGNTKQDPTETSWNNLINRYVQTARRDGRVWKLSTDAAKALFVENCFYCGCPPANTHNVFITKAGRVHTRNVERARLGEIRYNGLDRIDSSLGYSAENVRTCCSTCNFAKGTMTTAAFEVWLDRISAHRPRWGAIRSESEAS